jgi:hypothetical protein
MNTNGRDQTTTPNVAASVAEVTRNVIELTELQSQLLMLDLQKSGQKAKATIILAIIAACLLLASIPVALIAFGYLLVEQLEWSVAGSMALAALLGLVLCGTVAAVAYGYVKQGLVSLDRSRHELRRNVAWLKSTLHTQAKRPTETPINY